MALEKWALLMFTEELCSSRAICGCYSKLPPPSGDAGRIQQWENEEKEINHLPATGYFPV